jgi:hypothetical protein
MRWSLGPAFSAAQIRLPTGASGQFGGRSFYTVLGHHQDAYYETPPLGQNCGEGFFTRAQSHALSMAIKDYLSKLNNGTT